jgi:hypothetical protein
MEVEKPHIDQNALSRQLAVYGHEAQGKLMALRVFIYGISGVNSLSISLESRSQKILFLLVQSRSLSMTQGQSLLMILAVTFTVVRNMSEKSRRHRLL